MCDIQSKPRKLDLSSFKPSLRVKKEVKTKKIGWSGSKPTLGVVCQMSTGEVLEDIASMSLPFVSGLEFFKLGFNEPSSR